MSRKCRGCTRKFRPTKKYIHSDLCSNCRKNQKDCEICGQEIFVQARTCSKECAYDLRKISWKKTCGAEHNFAKNSKSRKKFEKRLLNEEGISNTAQRKEVKEKIKNTFKEKYNGINNPFGVKEIRNQIRKNKENSGEWIPLSELTKFQIYRKNVNSITRSNILKYGGKYIKNLKLLNLNSELEWKKKWSIDHIYSVNDGYQNGISPEIIASPVNIQIIEYTNNCSKNKRSDILLSTLIKKHKKFLNENKKDI